MSHDVGLGTDSNEANVVAERDFSSARISDTCRFIAFGILAATFSLLIADPKTEAHALLAANRNMFLLSAELSALALIFDYLHYVCANSAANAALKTNFLYDITSLSYRLGGKLYYAKQIMVIVSALIFVVVIALFGLTQP